MQQTATLVWFRQDLRIGDNPALSHAAARGDLLPIYIYDDTHPQRWAPGAASRWWLHHSLSALNQSLQQQLRLFQGDPLQLIPQLLKQTGIQRVVWNRCYEPWQIARDQALKALLHSLGIEVVSFNASLLWEPWEVSKRDGTPYKVFTPYYRNGCRQRPPPRYPLARPPMMSYVESAPSGSLWPDPAQLSAKSFSTEPFNTEPFSTTPWHREIAASWTPGEAGAAANLQTFMRDAIQHYDTDRDRPDRAGTSRLSPHLHFGELSPHQAWYVAQNPLQPVAPETGRERFLAELVWREFSYYLLYHWPTLPTDNFQAKFDRFAWQDKPALLTAWQRGQTGFPIIDAGMRELWQTGYMHNRVRMLVGSFLVKNLLIDWRAGAAWFWDTLLDADLASNSASWQWVAGSGADAAPYFRIFNPVTQGQKFDPEGYYVKRFCPELAKLPAKYIHSPWLAPDAIRQAAGVTLDETYPAPIVDLKHSRQQALAAFARLKQPA